MASFAYPRSARLPDARAFQHVLDAPSLRASQPSFVLLARENTLGCARVGAVLPKRRLRRAVARNRVKRIIRESFRARQDTLAGLDIVFMARDGLDALANPDLRAALDRQFQYLAGKWRARRDKSPADTAPP